MLFALISDIHANVDALRSVLADSGRAGVDQVLCLGDLVGYNAFPRETLALLRDHGVPSVHGNHDLMALGLLPTDGCGPIARNAIQWTRAELKSEDRRHLGSLPGELRPQGGMVCVHSVPGDPVVRLDRPEQFLAQAEALRTADPAVRLCFSGHTHRQGVMVVAPEGPAARREGLELDLPRDAFCFVNPGSVGYPRGRDPRAAYALFDPDAWRISFRRVAYDRRRVLEENRRVGLQPPSALGRLAARIGRSVPW